MKLKNLLQLAVQNAASPQTVTFDGTGDSASVYLKGVISEDFGVSASALRDAFDQAEGRPVSLFINSPGGDVFEGREMQGVIAAYAGKVTAIIQGVAASAATFVSLAASEVQMMKGSRYMIHNGWAFAMGGAEDMHAMGDLLSGFDIELAAEYAARTKAEKTQVSAWMKAETWFTADQALEHGFIDKVTDNTQNRAMAQAWNLAAYSNAPDLREQLADEQRITQQLQARRNRLSLLQI